ncbi:probable E3 ubiquitin-protein ligase DTX3 isoform X2 [Mauremys reevesii]|uniref:probable E3 ubiquitin-protein ligase DTX3 isoform X2 n=1 Tax=Mauremys reevesii TaxID=260615 RepID=UPI00193F6F72|nr:probable E3 ubiquitin-protein ligase DTX3 isoform X2 [Mauremys reevesii]
MGSPVSFVLSRMAACGGTTKNKLTVSKPVWDFLTKEAPSKLVKLKEETKLSILIDGETSEIYVLQLSTPAPGAGNGLYLARKALKALLKETEKELKKAQRQSELVGCMALLEKPGAELRPHGAGLVSRAQQPAGARAGARGLGGAAAGGSREEEQESQCPICLGEIQKVKTLEKCRHSFCEACITRALQVKRACPMCGRFYGQLVGNQPENGRMLVSKDSSLLLPGYEKYGTIIIQYVFPPGVQGVEHPNPGVRYPGTTRVAYLPDCPEGNKVLALFRKAFDQRLTFTIGTSMTTGRANVITWNDIHHKTNCTGGPQLFGYPDPTYLARVQEELRAKGLTED